MCLKTLILSLAFASTVNATPRSILFTPLNSTTQGVSISLTQDYIDNNGPVAVLTYEAVRQSTSSSDAQQTQSITVDISPIKITQGTSSLLYTILNLGDPSQVIVDLCVSASQCNGKGFSVAESAVADQNRVSANFGNYQNYKTFDDNGVELEYTRQIPIPQDFQGKTLSVMAIKSRLASNNNATAHIRDVYVVDGGCTVLGSVYSYSGFQATEEAVPAGSGAPSEAHCTQQTDASANSQSSADQPVDASTAAEGSTSDESSTGAADSTLTVTQPEVGALNVTTDSNSSTVPITSSSSSTGLDNTSSISVSSTADTNATTNATISNSTTSSNNNSNTNYNATASTTTTSNFTIPRSSSTGSAFNSTSTASAFSTLLASVSAAVIAVLMA